MTREEAIKEMIRAYDVLDFSSHMDNRRKEAFNMAKEALEQEPILDKIRVEIAELDIYYDNDYFSDNRDAMFKCNEILQIIDKYKEESEGKE